MMANGNSSGPVRRSRWHFGVLFVMIGGCLVTYSMSLWHLRDRLLYDTSHSRSMVRIVESHVQEKAKIMMHAFQPRVDQEMDAIVQENAHFVRLEPTEMEETSDSTKETNQEAAEQVVSNATKERSFQESIKSNDKKNQTFETDPFATVDPIERISRNASDQIVQDDALEEDCYNLRDNGAIETIAGSATTYCQKPSSDQEPASTYTRYYSPDVRVSSTLLTNWVFDLRNVQVHRPIADLSQDGGKHDPRFKYHPAIAHCFCAEPQDENTMIGTDLSYIWREVFPPYSAKMKEPLHACLSIANESQLQSANWTRIHSKAIVMARKHDHNPFFQVSATLMGRMMMRVLGWSENETQLVLLDDGYSNPVDKLQRIMLSPTFPTLRAGQDLVGSAVRFDQALVLPFEMTGPIMQHLNDPVEPCGRNQMVVDFRNEALRRLNVSQTKSDPRSCTITIISRRPYSGRMVQRKWLNEDENVAWMKKEFERPGLYKHGICTIQSIDFVDLALERQMQITIESDLVIGMHGAGMTNVLWSREGTKVIEIFPVTRKRWGYRNLCQFVGCDYMEFRGGYDTGKGGNNSDKTIPLEEWQSFFHTVMMALVKQLEATVA